MLSAIRLSGVIKQTTVIYDGAMNRSTFEGYVEHSLAPSLRPGDVVVMDNLSAHKSLAVSEIIEAVDAGFGTCRRTRLISIPSSADQAGEADRLEGVRSTVR